MPYDSLRRLRWAAPLLAVALLLPLPAIAEPVTEEVDSVVDDYSGADSGSDELVQVDTVPADEAAPAPLSIPSSLSGSPYQSVTGGTYWDLAEGIVSKSASATDDYLFYQSGESEYYLLIGDLSLSGSTVSGTDVRAVRFWRSGSSYDRQWLTESGTVSCSVSVGDYIVASSLGDYPAFELPGRSVSLVLCVGLGVALALFALVGLFRSVRGF